MILKVTSLLRFSALFYLMLLIGGCVHESRHTKRSQIAIDSSKYSVAAASKFLQNDVSIEAVLYGDPVNGELQLTMLIQNKRSDEITVDLHSCNLSIDDQREAMPDLQVQVGQRIIKAGQESEFSVRYHPVNSVNFYERTNYRGDMKKKYTLRPDFIKDTNGIPIPGDLMVFEFSDNDYYSYAQQGREKTIHIFDFDFPGEKFVHDQSVYLDRILSEASGAHEIFAITPAITIDRTVINFRTFKENDTLTVDMRLLNQSVHAFDIFPEKCEVKVTGKVFTPCKYYSDSFSDITPDSVYVFKPGMRLHLNLKYCITNPADLWKLDADWILIHKTNNAKNTKQKFSLFHSDISFRESPITKGDL